MQRTFRYAMCGNQVANEWAGFSYLVPKGQRKHNDGIEKIK